MNLDNSILEDVRASLGLSRDTADFDSELVMHINNAIGQLGQNGVGSNIVVTGVSEKWIDLQNPLQVEGNKFFHMVPLFITLSTKLIFDPPPPSTVEYYSKNITESLWRLKIAYEEITPKPDKEMY